MRNFASVPGAAWSMIGSAILVCALIGLSSAAVPSSHAAEETCESAPLAFTSNRDGDFDIYWMPDVCSPQEVNRVTSNAASDISPDVSPDGSKIVFASDLGGNWDIYVVNTDGTDLINCTTNRASDLFPSWSPDGSQIAFTTNRDNNWDIYIMNEDESDLRRVTTDREFEGDSTWSPDGTQIAYVRGLDNQRDIWVMDATGENPRPLIASRWADYSPAWHSNIDEQTGLIAYVSYDPARRYPGIYLIDPDSSDCNTSDGSPTGCHVNANNLPLTRRFRDITQVDPAWLPNGSRLVYGSVRLNNTDIFMIDVAQDETDPTQLTNHTADDRYPG